MGATVQGTVAGVENTMNIHLKNVKFTAPGREEKSIESMTIRGHSIRYVILPEQLALDNLLVEEKPKQGRQSEIPEGLVTTWQRSRSTRTKERSGTKAFQI
eukprot:TRINITY_DN2424_c0_g1_i1.p2 TRINITY_DN2424_c0_g1~~TRINITY_DN2424_c0_g1_i1.p2  ORF type:complete len:101 (-),score=2.85 TRINITY_DN2424_c0_g1_i1:119-421(-)